MKKWKIFLSVVVFLVVVGAGTVYYFLDVKEYETEDAKVDEIVEEKFVVELPEEVDEEPEQSAEQESSDSTTEEIDKDGLTASTDNKNTTSDASKKAPAQTNKPEKVSAASIIDRYQPSFKNLEGQASGKIDSLLAHAYSEYQMKKSSGEEISYFYFFSKYSSAATQLEASTDESFNYIYSALVKDLKKAGYTASEAQFVKDHYESVKKQRRSVIMKKAKSYLNI